MPPASGAAYIAFYGCSTRVGLRKSRGADLQAGAPRNDTQNRVITQSLMSLRDTPKHENAPSPQLPFLSSLSPGEREEGKGRGGQGFWQALSEQTLKPRPSGPLNSKRLEHCVQGCSGVHYQSDVE